MHKAKKAELERIPSQTAATKITGGCLILEGGGFRGLYTQGVLDALMLNDLNFECVIGVSAGALSGMNYVSGQIGRSARANLGFRHDSNYVGSKALKRSKSIIRLEFLFDEFEKTEPIDIARFNNPRQRFFAVATELESGKDIYFEKGKCSDIFKAIRASATMPFVSEPVNIDGKLYFDGGCSCKLPIERALDEGYKKTVVVRTRERGFVCKAKKMKAAVVYKKHPGFAYALETSNVRYARDCAKTEELEKQGKVFVVAPSEALGIKTVEGNIEKLSALYWLGFNDMISQIKDLENYLNM